MMQFIGNRVSGFRLSPGFGLTSSIDGWLVGWWYSIHASRSWKYPLFHQSSTPLMYSHQFSLLTWAWTSIYQRDTCVVSPRKWHRQQRPLPPFVCVPSSGKTRRGSRNRLTLHQIKSQLRKSTNGLPASRSSSSCVPYVSCVFSCCSTRLSLLR